MMSSPARWSDSSATSSLWPNLPGWLFWVLTYSGRSRRWGYPRGGRRRWGTCSTPCWPGAGRSSSLLLSCLPTSSLTMKGWSDHLRWVEQSNPDNNGALQVAFEFCWVQTAAHGLYLHFPTMLVFLSNLAFFALTTSSLTRTKRQTHLARSTIRFLKYKNINKWNVSDEDSQVKEWTRKTAHRLKIAQLMREGNKWCIFFFIKINIFVYFSKFKISHQVLSLKLFIVMGIPWIFEFVHFLLTVNIDNLGCYLSFQVHPPTIW